MPTMRNQCQLEPKWLRILSHPCDMPLPVPCAWALGGGRLSGLSWAGQRTATTTVRVLIQHLLSRVKVAEFLCFCFSVRPDAKTASGRLRRPEAGVGFERRTDTGNKISRRGPHEMIQRAYRPGPLARALCGGTRPDGSRQSRMPLLVGRTGESSFGHAGIFDVA